MKGALLPKIITVYYLLWFQREYFILRTKYLNVRRNLGSFNIPIWEIDRQRDRHSSRQKDRQTHRMIDTQTERLTLTFKLFSDLYNFNRVANFKWNYCKIQTILIKWWTIISFWLPVWRSFDLGVQLAKVYSSLAYKSTMDI